MVDESERNWEDAQEGAELLAEGDHDAAIRELHDLVDRQPRNEYAHFFLGSAYFEKQQYPKAMRAYLNALEIAPGYLGAMVNLGHTLRYVAERPTPIDGFFDYYFPAAFERAFAFFQLERDDHAHALARSLDVAYVLTWDGDGECSLVGSSVVSERNRTSNRVEVFIDPTTESGNAVLTWVIDRSRPQNPVRNAHVKSDPTAKPPMSPEAYTPQRSLTSRAQRAPT